MNRLIIATSFFAALVTLGCKKEKTAPPPAELAVTMIERGMPLASPRATR
jgi:hypothetical protein